MHENYQVREYTYNLCRAGVMLKNHAVMFILSSNIYYETYYQNYYCSIVIPDACPI